MNGKVYVGQTDDPGRRFTHHLNGNAGKINADLGVHGRSAFSFEILSQWGTRKEAMAEEARLIVCLDATDTSKGYNRVPTGGAGPGNTNAKANPVFQFTRDGLLLAAFRSEKEASELTGISRAQIGNVCRKGPPTYRTAGGFIWAHNHMKES